MKLSGFTFIHNAVEAGYPIVEAISMVVPFVDEVVVVDMESTDRTVELLKNSLPQRFGGAPFLRIVPGKWEPGTAGECLKKAHAQYRECEGDVVVHFEADEVYDYRLMQAVDATIKSQVWNIAVPRLQIEQNFQRVRWYPEYVHRVFPNTPDYYTKDGHTTVHHNISRGDMFEMPVEKGFLWDVTNCFRDNCIQRFKNQAELWGHEPSYKFTWHHSNFEAARLDLYEAQDYLQEPHWTWKSSPFKLPSLLERLVGVTSYGEY